MQVSYRQFRAGIFTSWEDMLAGVAQFGSSIGRSALLAITQSEDKDGAVATVWYRADTDAKEAALDFRIFRGGWLTSWDQVCNEAAEFASQIGPDRIASISQSEDKADGLVVIWYWV